tara:strand:+ start:51 stop:545 length:495 start_codon:yes stop_codon:yes gene_type:complete
MWIVAKMKKNQINILQESIKKKIGSESELYIPKIQITKMIKGKLLNKESKFLLGNYFFIKNNKFENSAILETLKYLKGLHSIVPFAISSQREIIDFINKCKKNENKSGFISQSFFNLIINKKIKFYSGPLTNFICELIEVEKNKIKVLVNNYMVTVNSKNKLLF